MSAPTPKPDVSKPDIGAPAPAAPKTPTSSHPVKHRPKRARRWLRLPVVAVVLGAAAVLFAGLYLVGYLAAGDKLPKKAQISGVSVGGLSQAQAVDKLVTELGPRAARTIDISIDGRTVPVAPAEAGLQVDYAASVARAGGGKSLNPRHILTVLTGGTRTEALLVVNNSRLNGVAQGLSATFDRAPVNASLAYAGTEPKLTPAQPGLAVNQPAAAAAIRQSFLQPSTSVGAPTSPVPAEITDEDVAQVVTSFATPAVSAPVQIGVGGGKSFPITPAMIAGVTTFVAKDGTLAPVLDAPLLRKQADPGAQKVLTKSKNATVRLVNGQPKVISAVDGAGMKADDLVLAVQRVLTKAGGERTATVALTRIKAPFTADDAAKLGVKEVTGRFTTYFPYQPYRNTNIAQAAARMNDTLVKPGATFSLNQAVGPRTKANGFVPGQAIEGTRARAEMGGEESQTAATAFSAFFFAGLKDVQHRPHAVYLDRLPAGREATVDGSKLDLKFRNDTRYGVLVETVVVRSAGGRRGSITVKVWSTKTYDSVVATPTARSKVTSGRSVRDGSAGCRPMTPAPGFDADYARLFYRGGAVVKRQKFHWRYAPTNRVTCI